MEIIILLRQNWLLDITILAFCLETLFFCSLLSTITKMYKFAERYRGRLNAISYSRREKMNNGSYIYLASVAGSDSAFYTEFKHDNLIHQVFLYKTTNRLSKMQHNARCLLRTRLNNLSIYGFFFYCFVLLLETRNGDMVMARQQNYSPDPPHPLTHFSANYLYMVLEVPMSKRHTIKVSHRQRCVTENTMYAVQCTKGRGLPICFDLKTQSGRGTSAGQAFLAL